MDKNQELADARLVKFAENLLTGHIGTASARILISSVVKEEKRQRVDNQPYGSFFTEMFARMFTTHPYNWAPIGSMEHLDAAQEEDYVNFYKTFYVPANATLSIAGDIDINQTKKWIDKYFASMPKGQAINLYRDFINLSDADFEKRYSISKSNKSSVLNSRASSRASGEKSKIP